MAPLACSKMQLWRFHTQLQAPNRWHRGTAQICSGEACSCDEVTGWSRCRRKPHSKRLQVPRNLHLPSVPASASQDPIAYAKCPAHLQGPMRQLLE
jgi:hypothetical protein